VKLLLASLRAVLGAFSLVWVLDAQQTTSRSAKINEEMIFFFSSLLVLVLGKDSWWRMKTLDYLYETDLK
jgi:hypothetical protein